MCKILAIGQEPQPSTHISMMDRKTICHGHDHPDDQDDPDDYGRKPYHVGLTILTSVYL